MIRACVLALLMAGWVAPASAQEEPSAASLEQRQAELESLRGRLESAGEALQSRERGEQRARGELARAERALEQAVKRERELAGQRAALEAEQERIEGQQLVTSQALARHRQRLATELRRSYLLGRQQRLKLLLNQEDPAAVQRLLGYYRYFRISRSTSVAEVRRHLATLAELSEAALQRRGELKTLALQQAAQRQRLEEARLQRVAVERRARARRQEAESELQRLRGDEKALLTLLDQLRSSRARAAVEPDLPPFDGQRGHLRWPVPGNLLARFGSPRGASGLPWRGVLIGASAGTPVRAVYPGRVVYADRLRGFGLVMILDHGAGYLTVYAHSEALFRTVGESVRAGEEIARVGMDADNPEGGLYFEIRASGQPVDPLKWLNRSSSDTSSG